MFFLLSQTSMEEQHYKIKLKIFALLVVAGVAAAKELAGVDPNSLSCDPDGQIFLLLPHFEDCNKFYMCANGKEVEFTCPDPTIFDFEAQTCAWDRDTKCWLRTEIDDGSGDDPSILDESEGHSADVLADFMRPAKVETPHGAIDAIMNCRTLQSASQQVAYRGDCQRYWRCDNGVPQAVYCSDGLYFNPSTRQCDYEVNVKCHVIQEDELQGEFMVYK